MAAERIPPRRRPELLLRPFGDDGTHVVKDPASGAYFNLPPPEAFLLAQLDGQQSVHAICAAFEQRFGEKLSAEDLDGFIEMARGQRLLVAEAGAKVQSSKPAAGFVQKTMRNILYLRYSFFDPDRLFDRLEPWLRWAWTASFLWVSAACIAVAALVFWANVDEYAAYLPDMIRWETLVLGWLVLCVVTTGHEFAHGLTCKHYGGQVHEVGFLLMFFMPCFYCNVSDAWLFKEKSRRLWVMLAGGYFDLCMWAAAVVAWRVLLPDTLPHDVAWLVMSICGGRCLINFNPLLRLDGYYLLSDWLEIPNLRKVSYEYVANHVRWLLWGAARPAREARGRTLLLYGVLSQSFSLFYVTLMLVGMFYLMRDHIGVAVSAGIESAIGWMVYPGLLAGLTGGEVFKMFRYRHARVATWAAVIAAVLGVLFLVPVEDWVSGTFRTRAMVRQEVRAPVSGFLHVVYVDEGSAVKEKAVIGCIEIPDLASKLEQKEAELRESQAKLKLLLAGTRPEQLAEQRLKVARAHAWRDRARLELERKEIAMREELDRLKRQVVQAQTQVSYAHVALEQARKLLRDNALPQDHYREAERQYVVSREELGKAEAQQRERLAIGLLEAESELARRAKELSDEESALKLLEAGSRPEEIDAERARLARLEAEKAYLRGQQQKLQLVSPVSGVIVTAHLREQIGQYYSEGELICEIEDPQRLGIEVPIDEQDVSRVSEKLQVLLKPRALPLQTVAAEVERVAPSAYMGKVQSAITVYCQLQEAAPELIPGMTGYARIYTGRTSIAGYIGGRALRYFRTEIWW